MERKNLLRKTAVLSMLTLFLVLQAVAVFASAPAPPPPQLVMSKTVYAQGEQIVVNYSNLPNGTKNWIGIFAQGAGNRSYGEWYYTYGAASGTMTFAGLNAGSYEARLFYNATYDLVKMAPFTVTDNGLPPEVTKEGLITLQNTWNSKYVAVLGSGHCDRMKAERTNPNDLAEEQFVMTVYGCNDLNKIPDRATVSLRTTPGYYWSSRDDGDLDAKEINVYNRSKFRLINLTHPGGYLLNGDQIGLQNLLTGKYVNVRTTDNEVDARGTALAASAEKFIVNFLPAPAPLATGAFNKETINFFDGVGNTRSFRYYIPAVAGPLPVVFDLHGHGGTADGLEGYHKLGNLAKNRQDFIWIAPYGTDYPDGLNTLFGTSWNGVVCCPAASNATPLFGGLGVHDVEFLRALVYYVSQRANVNLDRVYAHGHSNGAAMVHQLGLQAADVFAAISPASFPLSDSPWANAITQLPARPIPVFNIWGAWDELLAIIPGYVPFGTVYDGVGDWAAMNGCDGPWEQVEGNDIAYTRKYNNCDCGVGVELWQVEAGHEVYGTPQIGERILEFFNRYTRQCN